MPTAIKREQDTYKYPADEYFPAILQGVEEKHIPYFKKDRNGMKTNQQAEFVKWVWNFEIVGGEFTGSYVDGETNSEYTTREDNQIRIWGETLLGRELAVGDELNTDLLTGLPCLISVKHEEPRPRKDGGMYYGCLVDEVMPRSGSYTEEPPF